MEHLGSGQFGTVNKGIWQSPAGAVEVAVKTLQSSALQEDGVKFLQEAAIMGQFKHSNVVELLGVITVGEPVSKQPTFFACTGKTLYIYHYKNKLVVLTTDRVVSLVADKLERLWLWEVHFCFLKVCRYKTWILNSGLDYGLDYGLDIWTGPHVLELFRASHCPIFDCF